MIIDKYGLNNVSVASLENILILTKILIFKPFFRYAIES